MSLLHKLQCALHFVLFFKLMCSFKLCFQSSRSPFFSPLKNDYCIILLLKAILKFMEIAQANVQFLTVKHI